MYCDEHPAFKTAVYRESLCDELWRELDALIEGYSLNHSNA